MDLFWPLSPWFIKWVFICSSVALGGFLLACTGVWGILRHRDREHVAELAERDGQIASLTFAKNFLEQELKQARGLSC